MKGDLKMLRMLGSCLLVLMVAWSAYGHFVFVLPQPGGTEAQMIFSDDLEPDGAVDVSKIGATKLSVRDAAGKVTPLTMKKGQDLFQVAVPGSGPRVIFGVTE